MAFEGPAHEWLPRERYVAAASAGLAWSLAWYGLSNLGAPALVLPLASALLLGPVLAALARVWRDLALLGGTSYLAAIAMAAALLPTTTSLPANAWAEALGRLGIQVFQGWVLVWAVAALLFSVRRRWRTHPKPAAVADSSPKAPSND